MTTIPDLIAEARGADASWSPVTLTGLIDRLADALEAQSERLAEQTGGRLSYTTYPVRVMSQEIDAYHERMTEEDCAEYRAIANEALRESSRLRAAIRDALDVVCSGSVPLGVTEAFHYDRLLAESRRILTEALEGTP